MFKTDYFSGIIIAIIGGYSLAMRTEEPIYLVLAIICIAALISKIAALCFFMFNIPKERKTELDKIVDECLEKVKRSTEQNVNDIYISEKLSENELRYVTKHIIKKAKEMKG